MIHVWIANSLVVALAVGLHYEFLYQLTKHLPRLRIRHRFRIVVGVFAALMRSRYGSLLWPITPCITAKLGAG